MLNIRFTAVIITMLVLVSASAHAGCQPQCVPYARKASGITTNRVGATGGAIDWFNQAKSKNSTTLEPRTGSVMVLDPGHPCINDTYGHVLSVQSVDEVRTGKTFSLLVGHANGDGNCSVEENIAVSFCRETMLAEFKKGFLKGQTIKVLGFIYQ